MSSLYRLTGQYRDLSRIDDEGGSDDALIEAVRNTLIGLDDEIEGAIASLAKVDANLGALAKSAAAEAKRLRERVNHIGARQARIRHAIRDAMRATGLPPVVSDTHTVSLRKGGLSVSITDASKLPANMLRTTTEPNLSLIGDALRAGTPIDGATLVRGDDSVSIR